MHLPRSDLRLIHRAQTLFGHAIESKTCFFTAPFITKLQTEFAARARSQTEFGNEEKVGAGTRKRSHAGAWERGKKAGARERGKGRAEE